MVCNFRSPRGLSRLIVVTHFTIMKLPTVWSVFAAGLLAALPIAWSADVPADSGLKLGVHSWTLRNLKFEQAVDFARNHGFKRMGLSLQFDPLAPRETLLRQKAILAENGIEGYTFGVAATSLNKEENRRLFEAAKLMGMSLIVVEPKDFKIFDQLEELVREYDIRIAVHNHGIRSLYGNPAVLKNILMHRDPRMGVCLDVGWVTAAGFDAAKIFREYEGRVFDIHLKDKKVEPGIGEPVAADTFIGQGNANLTGLLVELKKAHWQGTLALETDSQVFAQSPAEFVDKARVYIEKSMQ